MDGCCVTILLRARSGEGGGTEPLAILSDFLSGSSTDKDDLEEDEVRGEITPLFPSLSLFAPVDKARVWRCNCGVDEIRRAP